VAICIRDTWDMDMDMDMDMGHGIWTWARIGQRVVLCSLYTERIACCVASHVLLRTLRHWGMIVGAY
jgi:hypothetical protein